MASEFESCVDYGLSLSKRIYYGRSSATVPAVAAMTRSKDSTYLPEAVMVYAMVSEPEVVDNPEVPSYQPYVHGKCEPPALIPLHMNGVSMEVDCCLDTAFVTVEGTWHVHCIMACKKCDCKIAVPMGEQGSLLGVEVDIGGKLSYNSKLITTEDANENESARKGEAGRYLKGQIYTFKIPEVNGGSTLSIRISWSQKLTYEERQFCLCVPFTFPAYVFPVGKKISKREKIQLKVNSGINSEIICKCTSHPLKELSRGAGKMSFVYEAHVESWSSTDFNFSYAVCSNDLFGAVLLQTPQLLDVDARQMFCLYLFPGNGQNMKVFRKAVVFLVDISGSMKGALLENVKSAVLASLYKLSPQDSFNIIAFNGEANLFSSSLELASQEAIINASRWLNSNLIAEGGTNILLPLKQAIKLLSNTSESIPLIFLITDGAVDDERQICKEMKGYLLNTRSISPRICTFGIGSFCNHYFLQMLAQIGSGYYDSAQDPDYAEARIQRLFKAASSVILANITLDTGKDLDFLELFPSYIPDLSSRSPLVISGRYDGTFPDSVKINGTTADMSNFMMELKAQKAKDVPLSKVLARRQIDMLTAHAWWSESKELEDKVANISIQTGVPSEYTPMILLQSGSKAPDEPVLMQEILNKITLQKKVDPDIHKVMFIGNLGIGFGNLKATAKNTQPGTEEPKPPDAAQLLAKVASSYFSRLLDRFCCMCCIQTCSHVNNQCYIVLTQLCSALACCQCVECCTELCECF